MDRRSFVGTVIGILAGSGASFVAQPPARFRAPKTPLERAKQLMRMMELPMSKLRRFRVIAILQNGEEFEGPGVKDVIRSAEKLEIDFIFQSILISKENIVVTGMKIIDDMGVAVAEQKLTHPAPALIDDTLNLIYNLRMSL